MLFFLIWISFQDPQVHATVTPDPAVDHVFITVYVNPPDPTPMSIIVYDTSRSEIKTIITSIVVYGGSYSFIWDLTDNDGKRIRPGLYLLYFEAVAGDFFRRVYYITPLYVK